MREIDYSPISDFLKGIENIYLAITWSYLQVSFIVSSLKLHRALHHKLLVSPTPSFSLAAVAMTTF